MAPDMLAALIEHLDLRDITLAGNCIGAATALRYAAEEPVSGGWWPSTS